jgi:hypothetical protein
MYHSVKDITDFYRSVCLLHDVTFHCFHRKQLSYNAHRLFIGLSLMNFVKGIQTYTVIRPEL